MSILVSTPDPHHLRASIRDAIINRHIDTWTFNDAGDFTHTRPQFDKVAWLRPEMTEGRLRLFIVPEKKMPLQRFIYAIYHGRFIEMLIAHFPEQFTVAAASSVPALDERQVV